MAHDWHKLTEHCVKCGCSRADYVHGFRDHCDELGNVVGVTHIILMRQAQKFLGEGSSNVEAK